jgi:proline iminopeptidase
MGSQAMTRGAEAIGGDCNTVSPYRVGELSVGGGHSLYYEESGRRDGTPVVILHGGPGAGASPTDRGMFDTRKHRIVIFDQRGAGRSRPLGAVKGNTIADLIDDLETLRRHLRISKWAVFGRSWGSVLALAYGAKYPEACLGFLLHGFFPARSADVERLFYGMAKPCPAPWKRFAEFIPAAERVDLVEAYLRRLTSPDEKEQLAAALSLANFNRACATFGQSTMQHRPTMSPAATIASARILLHYARNAFFLADGIGQDIISRVHHLPAIVVHGDRDAICLPGPAIELARQWPEAKLMLVKGGSHSAFDPLCFRALVRAAQQLSLMIGAAGQGAVKKPDD